MIKIFKLQYLKRALQILLLLFSIILIALGFWGPQFAPKNPTTLFVWIHYRAFLVLSLLLWGNIFCMSCPFIFVRDCLRIFIIPKYLWPKRMQNKWTALFLFCSVLFFYEYLSLWASPFKTALLISLFFGSAIIVDLTFKKASFCKYLCPIGQFNFLASTLSPREVKAKNLSVCQDCKTMDCLLGNKELNLRGCELHLLIPKKVGNLDCTFCMDCVVACPYENIQVAKIIPSTELWLDVHRSGIGVLSKRRDILACIVAFTFGSLLNAFSMIGPSYIIKEKLKMSFHFQNDFFILFLFFIFFLILLPAVMLIFPVLISSLYSKNKFSLIPSLLPVGFSIWIAHYSYHLLTGFFTFIPLITNLSMPVHLMGLSAAVVIPLQLGILFLGFIGSVFVCSLMKENKKTQAAWISTHFLITLIAIWILTSPMEMRGTFLGIAP